MGYPTPFFTNQDRLASEVEVHLVKDESVLRRKCEPVSLKDGRALARQMIAWLERNNKAARRPLKMWEAKSGRKGSSRPTVALGIAAPQLGVSKRVCITYLNDIATVFINPRIVEHGEVKISAVEGCLSFPGKSVDTYRFPWVAVEADNFPARRTFGCTSAEEWTGAALLEAICVQHEISHLFGLLFDDFKTTEYPDPRNWGISLKT